MIPSDLKLLKNGCQRLGCGGPPCLLGCAELQQRHRVGAHPVRRAVGHKGHSPWSGKKLIDPPSDLAVVVIPVPRVRWTVVLKHDVAAMLSSIDGRYHSAMEARMACPRAWRQLSDGDQIRGGRSQ